MGTVVCGSGALYPEFIEQMQSVDVRLHVDEAPVFPSGVMTFDQITCDWKSTKISGARSNRASRYCTPEVQEDIMQTWVYRKPNGLSLVLIETISSYMW